MMRARLSKWCLLLALTLFLAINFNLYIWLNVDSRGFLSKARGLPSWAANGFQAHDPALPLDQQDGDFFPNCPPCSARTHMQQQQQQQMQNQQQQAAIPKSIYRLLSGLESKREPGKLGTISVKRRKELSAVLIGWAWSEKLRMDTMKGGRHGHARWNKDSKTAGRSPSRQRGGGDEENEHKADNYNKPNNDGEEDDIEETDNQNNLESNHYGLYDAIVNNMDDDNSNNGKIPARGKVSKNWKKRIKEDHHGTDWGDQIDLVEQGHNDDTPSPPPLHHLCVLVPYRDRFEELMEFIPYMTKFLSEQIKTTVSPAGRLPYSFNLVIMNQVDGFRFNRGSLINAGYFEARSLGCDYLAMHDVDLLPANPQLRYNYPPNDLPYHIAAPEYHPRYHYEKFIGGILMLTLDQFRRVNGMSNRYWGWGLEDDEFYVRLTERDLIPQRPQNLSSDATNTFRHVHNSAVRPRDNLRLFEQRTVSRRRDRLTGLDSLEYSVRRRYNITVNDSSKALLVEVELTCDIAFTPWCQTIESLDPETQKLALTQDAQAHRRSQSKRKTSKPA